jgi:hypothetical protein
MRRALTHAPPCQALGSMLWRLALITATVAICAAVWPLRSLARVHDVRMHPLHSHSLVHPSYRCGLFGGPPCFPYETCSSVFRRQPCLADVASPIGENGLCQISFRRNWLDPASTNESTQNAAKTVIQMSSASLIQFAFTASWLVRIVRAA